MGRPKKEKPADPILGTLLAADATMLPALGPALAPLGGNALAAADPMGRGIRRIRFLQQQIDVLNAQKSVVYAELALRGFDKALVKSAEKRLRMSAEERARLDAAQRAYEQAAEQSLAHLDVEEPEAADTDEKAAA